MKSMEVREYVVCYFDLLGQREGLIEKVRKADDVTALQGEIDSLSALIRGFNEDLLQTFGFIKEHGDAVLKFMGMSEESMPEFLDRIKQVHLGIQQFSDSTLFYAGAKDGDGMGFGLFLSFCRYFAAHYLRLVECGIPIRGAIAMGRGWEMAPNCLYGPVMEDVYRLESKVADSPRIVVAPNAFHRILEVDKEAASINAGPKPSEHFTVDFDGLYILDYLSLATIQSLETFGIDRRNVLGSLVRGIRSIRTTLDFYREKAKMDDHAGTIARKYALLQMYWMQRTGALEKYFDSTQPPLSQPISPSQDAQIKSNPVSQ